MFTAISVALKDTSNLPVFFRSVTSGVSDVMLTTHDTQCLLIRNPRWTKQRKRHPSSVPPLPRVATHVDDSVTRAVFTGRCWGMAFTVLGGSPF